ncbi:class I SAM-dependent methyltransferase [Actinokineospora soli]|uniref:Class I SAM-dependent methyltransferase n=1 Tax=Actinokineospora soli TaxID=1048753 RepID=A0ABW2TKF0_9PSEU
MTDAAALRARMYGEDDLSSLPVFAGGFINYGYWRGIPIDGPISQEQRVDSQLALYRLVYADLAGLRALEVGPGTGAGPGWAFAACGPAELHGVDLHPEQVRRCLDRNADAVAEAGGRFTFRQGAADALPFDDGAVDAVVSLEAAQHFDDLAGFAREAHRVLVPGGRLTVTTFFAPDASTAGRCPRCWNRSAPGSTASTRCRGSSPTSPPRASPTSPRSPSASTCGRGWTRGSPSSGTPRARGRAATSPRGATVCSTTTW